MAVRSQAGAWERAKRVKHSVSWPVTAPLKQLPRVTQRLAPLSNLAGARRLARRIARPTAGARHRGVSGGHPSNIVTAYHGQARRMGVPCEAPPS